MLLAVAT